MFSIANRIIRWFRNSSDWATQANRWASGPLLELFRPERLSSRGKGETGNPRESLVPMDSALEPGDGSGALRADGTLPAREVLCDWDEFEEAVEVGLLVI